jgi:hypothetical protein
MPWQKLRPRDHDLRALAQPCPLVGLNRHPHQWQVQDRAGERQHDQRRQIGEVIGLDHQRRPRLAGVTLQGDGDEIAALH